ncbi:MAG: molybdopterin-binding protein [Alphaproteobacteria bacterium]|uniref:Molybdopterin molybdenumtransferase n=1 Tax=Candidatus Nitrobium versatile TaxID=2884831 RepID=A0A953SHA6_9BACT|nr:molybdopterin-binding protein [Candidatus Nitrobium versatile]
MCEIHGERGRERSGAKAIPVTEAVGMVLAHDITEIRKEDFKGRAFRKGHVVTREDVEHLQRLGKDHLFVLHIADDEMHEDDAAYALASALKGEGVLLEGEPKEGKINLVAARDGLLKIDRDILASFNMLGEVMCATLHTNTVVKKGQVIAGTRAIPLVVKKAIIDEAVAIAERAGAVIEVKEMRKVKAGVVITGNEVYYGRIQDAFAPVVTRKIEGYNGEIVGIYYAPDDESLIEARLRELLEAGADLLITTGGMSVDPDDVTRFAIRNLGASGLTYGSAVLPGAMFLVAYLERGQGEQERGNGNASSFHGEVPLLGIPACGMYHKTTIFDLVLPRVLAGERVGRRELAELGHGGLCLNCKECRYPVCPFGK